ncbi:hypothetical protein DSOUD_2273 [Desulfuromonas soudanensis]|uniref:Uncharacterized protein n=2 Tax=Desulfuromonas soudanensis TaxID=1603606 RepID=A0A0M4DIJ8_9BACT|nr:hypothetical protein DSOUD_2273 [Desulfuromonas soudanensis]
MTFVSGRYIVFWQGIVSPHMAFLAKELVAMGYNVAYIVGAVMSEERAAMGWQAPSIPEVRLEFVENVTQVETLLNTFPEDTIHIVQGIRG